MNKFLQTYGLLLLCSLLWGSQFVLIEVGLRTLPVLSLAAGRLCIGFFVLQGLCLMPRYKTQQQAAASASPWGWYVIIGLFEAVFPCLLIAWAQQRVDSALAAIIIASVPIFTLLFLGISGNHQSWTWQRVCCVLIGFLGIIFLFAPQMETSNMSQSLAAQFALLLASASFAMSLICLQKIPSGSPVHAMRNSIGIAAFVLSIFAVYMNHNAWLAVSHESLLAMALLGIFCSSLVYVFYLVLVRRADPHFASLCNYLIPLVGVFLGIAVLHDTLAWNQIMSLIIILSALVINEL